MVDQAFAVPILLFTWGKKAGKSRVIYKQMSFKQRLLQIHYRFSGLNQSKQVRMLSHFIKCGTISMFSPIIERIVGFVKRNVLTATLIRFHSQEAQSANVLSVSPDKMLLHPVGKNTIISKGGFHT